MPTEPAVQPGCPAPEPLFRGTGRRIAIAATAFLACLAPAACDVAAASPAARPTTTNASHNGYNHHGTKTAKPTATAVASGGDGSTDPAATTEPAATTDPATDPDPTTDPNASVDPSAPVDPGATVDPSATVDPTVAPTTAPTTPPVNNGLDVLGRDCSTSKLQPHTGFQISPACVSTAFGEVSAVNQNPSLLITKSPRFARANTPFTISVSTRNLVRDRFLGAAAGGYYEESSFLNAKGLQRGHFHTACRMLPNTNEAPDAEPVPAFFVATQDNGGGAAPDTVVVNVTTGLPRGQAQCTVWAGDGSHRVPMMTRANQTPAIDSVRITVF